MVGYMIGALVLGFTLGALTWELLVARHERERAAAIARRIYQR